MPTFDYPADTLSARLFQLQRAMSADALPMQLVPFGEWLPDRADLGNPGATVARNVIPVSDGYRPFPGLTVGSNALATTAIGAGGGSDTAGNAFIYVGTRTGLSSLVNQTFTDVSGATYITAEDGNWEFVLFGQTMVATNFDDHAQGLTLGGAAFANLITSSDKPKARHAAAVREFVVLGNTNDAVDGAKPNRVWWSGIDDATNFTPAQSTQCDYNDLPVGGWVQKIVGGLDYGLVFCERAVYRMTYVGTPLVFRFDQIERARGTAIPNSVVGKGRFAWYISEEGVMMTDGFTSKPIGHEKVDRWFWNQFDRVYNSRVSSAIFPLHKLVMWAFPGTGHSSGVPNTVLVYNWATDRFSYALLGCEMLFSSVSQGYTLDTLDTVSTDIDALAFSLDSRAWTGGSFIMGAVDTSNRYATLTGSNLAALLETGEVQPNPQGYTEVTSVRPIIQDTGNAPDIACSVAARDRSINSPVFNAGGDAVTLDGTNDYLTRGADLTGNADGQRGIFYLRFTPDASAAGSDTIYANDAVSGTSPVQFNYTAGVSERVTITLRSSSANLWTGNTGTGSFPKGSESSVLVSWDLSIPNGVAYKGDTALSITGGTSPTLGTVDYTVGNHWVGFDDLGVGFEFHGTIFELYLNFSDYLDFSVEANRRKFIDASGNPVDLGVDGSVPTGRPPIIFLKNYSGDSASAFATNRGSGGNFTITGSLDSAAHPVPGLSLSSNDITPDGECPIEVSGRYLRFRVTIAQGDTWSFAQGVQPTMTLAGGA